MRRLNLPGNSLTFRPTLEPVLNDEQSILLSNFISHNTPHAPCAGTSKARSHTKYWPLSFDLRLILKKMMYKHNNDFKRTKKTGNLRFKVI